jgi:hypothetical protein
VLSIIVLGGVLIVVMSKVNRDGTSQQVGIKGKKSIVVDAKDYFGLVQEVDGGEGIRCVDHRLSIVFVKGGGHIDP